MKTVLMFSGGVDSTVLLYDLLAKGNEVLAVGFNYGQPHVRELAAATEICARLGVEYVTINVDPFLGKTVDGLIFPNRNAIFVSLASGLAKSRGFDRVAIGVQFGDNADFPDCRGAFFYKMNEALELAEMPPVYYPFGRVWKSEVVALGRRLGVDFDLTRSCYRDGDKPCGECHACEERDRVL